MNGQAIPGFYWDPEKKKYFKIQSATASRDLNLKYSAPNIRKKEREERIQSTVSARIQRARKERVVRHTFNNVTQACLEREIGVKRRSYYVQSTWPEACMYGMSTKPRKVIDKPPGPPIRRFDRDPVSKTMYIVHGENSIKRRRIHTNDGPPLPSPDFQDDDYLDDLPLNKYSFEPWDELQRTTSTISSLTYLPATGALATTTYGSDRPPVVYLSDPERDGPYVGQQFTPKGCAAIWGASARPTSFSHSPSLTNTIAASHIEHLAVAASSSMLLFTRSQTGTWNSTTPVASLDTDVLALNWISYTTIALGCRDGKIRLHDTRSGGSSHILTHPHAVSKIACADDPTRLIVSGLQDSLFLYDIRSARTSNPKSGGDGHYNADYFEHVYPGGRNHKKRRKMNRVANRHWSHPVLTFPHANVDDLELGIDVHPTLGLVAAGQNPEASVAIRVSNIWTGRTVKEFSRDVGKSGGSDRIRCLKFMDDEEELGGVSLWANWAGGVARFGW